MNTVFIWVFCKVCTEVIHIFIRIVAINLLKPIMTWEIVVPQPIGDAVYVIPAVIAFIARPVVRITS